MGWVRKTGLLRLPRPSLPAARLLTPSSSSSLSPPGPRQTTTTTTDSPTTPSWPASAASAACPCGLKRDGAPGSVRSKNSHPKTQTTCLALVLTLVIVLPLIVTGTMSFGKAKGICYERCFVQLTKYVGDDTGDEKKSEFDHDNAGHHLLYLQHLMNSTATVASFCGYSIWLFASPHTLNAKEERLDRTRAFCFSFLPAT